jgi:hypothetical protein
MPGSVNQTEENESMNRVVAATILLVGLVMVAGVAPASAATSVASINGTYNFQVSGVTNQYGYYTCSASSCTWVQVSTCPKGVNCENQTFAKATVGTLSFNGKGVATFTSISQYNNGGGGPVVGTTCTYTVSGYAASLTKCSTKGVALQMGTVTLTLGAFNASNVSTTLFILTPDGGNSVSTGTATLQ